MAITAPPQGSQVSANSISGKNRSAAAIEPLAGCIRFEGCDVREAGKTELREVRRRLQMIFQDPYGSLNSRKTVGSPNFMPALPL